MNLYQELQCHNYQEINQQILDYVYSSGLIDSSTTFWNPINTVNFLKAVPLFQQWALSNKLMIQSVAVTIGRSLQCCEPHVDTPPARYKLSWPVLNYDQSFNRWFKEKSTNPKTIVNMYNSVMYQDVNDLEEIGRRTISGPAIIDAGIPHDVQFLVDNPVWPRIGLQCQLFKEPKSL
jgi:hypothetical protein